MRLFANLTATVALAVGVVPAEAPPFAVSTPADAAVVASRIPAVDSGAPVVPSYSPTVSGRRCVGAEDLLAFYSPGWDVARMSRIMWRESRCQSGAYNRRGRAVGLLQITPITHRYLAEALGQVITAAGLFDPVLNIRAAAALWANGGYGPWRT